MRASSALAILILASGGDFAASLPPAASLASVAMRSVNGELIESLDSRTAKTGDRVAIKTRSAVLMADGTDIPRGSRLIGHVAGAKAAGAGDANAQIALVFDRLELKDGTRLLIRGEIQAVLSPGDALVAAPDMLAPPGSSLSTARGPGDMYGSTPAPGTTQVRRDAPTGTAEPATSGTLVARSGDLAIRTTGIPGLLLAQHEAQNWSAAQSSILLEAGHDIHLESGIHIQLGVVLLSAATPVTH
ncbi:MAG TPA: hypothetical protein VHZ28_17500 [Terracidiphilus sp.]|jgi:hypothetical protein|nr:hypothetical protein [Terracidiphilus sp.]